jgi:hypothetical protein
MSLWRYANPAEFLRITGPALPALWALTALTLGGGLTWGFFLTPDDYQQGATVKILFIHVPAALTVGLKRGGLLLSLLVLPLYVPTLIFGAEVVKRGATGMEVGTPLALLAGITAASAALLPYAAAAAIRINLR